MARMYTYEQGESSLWRHESGTPASDDVFCADRSDHSRAARMHPGLGTPDDYDPRCASCWLGHGHTINHHKRRVREALDRADNAARAQAFPNDVR